MDHVPELRGTLGEHEELNGELLTYVFIEDTLCEWLTGSFADRSNVLKVVAFLEETIGTVSEEVDNLIGVSFVESLPYFKNCGPQLVDMFGPKLRAKLERQESWKPGQE